MKRIKTILCIMLMIILGGTVLYGCGGDESIITTITLAEAKTVIVNALALDEVNQTKNVNLSEEQSNGNRDITKKFGGYKLTNNCWEAFSNQSVNGVIKEEGETYFSLSNKIYYSKSHLRFIVNGNDMGISDLYYWYFSLSENKMYNLYTDYDISDKRISSRDFSFEDEIGDFAVNEDINKFIKVFTDENFEKAYLNEVTKVETKNNYHYILKTTYYDYMRLDSKLTYEEYENYVREMSKNYFGNEETIINDQKAFLIEVKVEFNLNNEIVAMNIIGNGKTYLKLDDSSAIKTSANVNLKLEKFSGTISEPDWVTNYIANQN